MRHLLHILTLLTLSITTVYAQGLRYDEGEGVQRNSRGELEASTRNDSVETTDVPVELKVWRIDERFGQRYADTPDTLSAYFPQKVFTSGPTMRYNTTGNYGAPRMSRIYNGQDDWMMGDQFLFVRPYDYFITPVSKLLYTNTKSPFTNLTYNSCGNKTNGEDRITAQFAVNAGKKIGMGFLLDYLYGRGYYQSQNTGHFGGGVYGSYIADRYNMHFYYNFNYLKNAENGGIESDDYITHPEILPASYRSNEIPVRLEDTYNYIHYNTIFLTHKYNIGGYVVVRQDTVRVEVKTDSLQYDSLKIVPISEFNPVASVIHTMRIGHNNRRFLSGRLNNSFFADDYFTPLGIDGNSTSEKTRNYSVQNTVALEMHEGFRPWVKMGMRVFAKHDYERFILLDKQTMMSSYNENYLSLGAQILREQGKLFHFNVLGEFRTTGKRWGEFNAEGWMKFDIPLKRDSLSIKAHGYVRNEQPSFYYRHYHGRNAWWDNNLSNVFRTRVGMELRWWKTRLFVNLENITNYTHFAHRAGMPLYGVDVVQAPHAIQTIEATLRQDFAVGILHWDNELTLQHSTDREHLPLPLFSGYTNLYIQFRIAKVLNTQLGVDARYFTRYYAPDYSPAIGQFATQSADSRVKIGNYPWVNAYLNFHLKRARFYVMYTHLTKMAGPYFLTPHYPTNGRVFRLGVSWNFIN